MFEQAEIGNKIEKEKYHQLTPAVREGLLREQKRLAESNLSVIILINGVEAAGKGETVNLLLEWLDARGVETHAVWTPSAEEQERPEMWRFWRALPGSGRIGIFFGSWYTTPIIDRVFDRIDDESFEIALRRINDFEQMLANENTLLIKFWLHLSHDAQQRKLKKMRKDPSTKWRVTDIAKKFFKKRKKFRRVDEAALSRTSTFSAPWHVIEAEDNRYRNLTVSTIILDSLKQRLDEIEKRAKPERVFLPVPPPTVNIIKALDQTLALSDEEYDQKLDKYRPRISELTNKLSTSSRSLVAVFEGPDAAGKGGAIRRLISGMDARHYRVISFAAPTDEERGHPYLWRFWRHVPPWGMAAIFDRSWYGRVLVERIEGFCQKEDWQRAYSEIREFEQQLVESGTIIVKFWIATTSDEQLLRFQTRKVTPYKQYKLTEEDWRNRERWDAYENAACEMVEKTSTERAPWVLVEGNNKNWARIKVLKTIAHVLKDNLE
jgi:polyphosphate:AMP phosphotransferase